MNIRAEDASILLQAVEHAASLPDRIGHLDAARLLSDYRRYLAFHVQIPKDIVEGSLYAVLELGRIGKFWHPRHKSPATFIRSLLPPGTAVDMTSGLIEKTRQGD